eukprot:GHVT01104776.1.p1 GENE.GHVT01104776.1~~GHVT01104776.1.p1  ORF type:complete len:241 (+),score=43.19 GHVT01104776.1:1296-2018(+)
MSDFSSFPADLWFSDTDSITTFPEGPPQPLVVGSSHQDDWNDGGAETPPAMWTESLLEPSALSCCEKPNGNCEAQRGQWLGHVGDGTGRASKTEPAVVARNADGRDACSSRQVTPDTSPPSDDETITYDHGASADCEGQPPQSRLQLDGENVLPTWMAAVRDARPAVADRFEINRNHWRPTSIKPPSDLRRRTTKEKSNNTRRRESREHTGAMPNGSELSTRQIVETANHEYAQQDTPRP